MTRTEAIEVISEIIDSGIINTELEEELTEVCNCIEEDSFEEEYEDDELYGLDELEEDEEESV